MKLLKPKTGYWVFGGGNVNTVTTLVEVRWLEFRTGVRFPHLHKMTPKAIVLSGVVFCLIENLGDFLSENKHFVQAMRTCTRKNSNCGLTCVFHKIDTFIRYTLNY